MLRWKKALFFGGAVLVLAACDQSVTAPSGLSRAGGMAAAKSPTTSTTTTTTTTKKSGTQTMDAMACTDSSNALIRTGEEGGCTIQQ